MAMIAIPTTHWNMDGVGWGLVSVGALLLLCLMLFISFPIWLAIFASTICSKERLLAVASFLITSITTVVATI